MDTISELMAKIRDVPDFPKKGILFKDITTLLRDPVAFASAIDHLHAWSKGKHVDLVVGMESRGFILGAPLAYKLKAGFVPVRKEGKLPAPRIRESYSLEYGENVLEMHVDAIQAGQRVLVVDDLLATGGTIKATLDLVRRLGGVPVGVAVLVELGFLEGRKALPGCDIHSLITY